MHQAFVPGRSAEALDWIADTLGAALGAALRSGIRLLRRRRHAAAATLVPLLLVVIVSPARADESNAGDCQRPFSEISTWIPFGGGAAVPRNGDADAIVHTGLGYDWTFPLAFGGDLRFGPWGSVETADFVSLQLAGGLELLGGAIP